MASKTDRPCAIDDCPRSVGLKGAKDYCSIHYHRLLRYGDPLRIPKFTPTKRPAVCTMEGCEKPCRARRLCSTHHQRWRVRGNANVVLTAWSGHDREAAIRSRVRKETQHWYWTGYKDKKGCGWYSGRPAHVLIWEMERGPVPAGKQLDHLCRIHDCVRPECLEPVTQQENINRGIGIPVINRAKTHCPANHEYAGENLYIGRDGSRYCRQCARDRYTHTKNAHVRDSDSY